MRYAMMQTNGRFINTGYNETGPVLFMNSGYPEYYRAEKSESVFYLKGQHFLVAIAEDAGKEFEIIREYALLDETGARYNLDWKNKKIGDMGVISVPIKEIIKRSLPDDCIPEIWKKHKQFYIDHIAIKITPHDYCVWRYDDMEPSINDIQSVTLDKVDYAIKRYISEKDSSIRYVNDMIRRVHRCRKADDGINTMLLIMPLVIDPLEELLTKEEIYEHLPRLLKAKAKIQPLIDELAALPPPAAKTIRFIPPDTDYAPF